MAEGYFDFVAGNGLAAANLEDYCERQAIMRFASAAARDTALSAIKTEGMMAYLLDVNTLTVYSGTTWSTIGPIHGALPVWAPTITQSGSVTYTTTLGTYSRIGRRIFYEGVFLITGTGSASNAITITLPVTAVASNVNVIVGTTGYLSDNSASSSYGFTPVIATTTTLKLLQTPLPTGGAGALIYVGTATATFSAALAVNDFITLSGNYEAAADA